MITEENLKDYIKFCQKWEGGKGRSTNDSASAFPCPTPFEGKTGWHTVKGVTYQVWVNEFGKNNDARFFAMSDKDWFQIFKKRFFDKVLADEFNDFKISAIITEIAWMSGPSQAGKTLQRAINELGGKVIVDGSIGKKTVEAANVINSKILFDKIIVLREAFYRKIATGKNTVFLKGWLNRLKECQIAFLKFK